MVFFGRFESKLCFDELKVMTKSNDPSDRSERDMRVLESLLNEGKNA